MPNRRAPAPIGDKFAMLTVVGEARDAKGKTAWMMRCECGTVKQCQPSHIRAGSTLSCGCGPNKGRQTHGMSRTPTYASWIAMRERCQNPNATKFLLYGGRGINVCDEWQSFERFAADMGPRPSLDHSIEREDGNGDYQPSNCRWATYTEQNRNRSNVRRIDGKTMGEIAVEQGRSYYQVRADVLSGVLA